MPRDRPVIAESIDPGAAEAVVRECLVVLGIAFLTGLALLVPGAGRELPGTGITAAGAIVAVGTAAIVGSLLYAIPSVRDLVSSALAGPDEVVSDVSAVVGHLVAFVAVLLAYRGLASAVVPLLDGEQWAYDQAFFLCATIVLALIARRLYRSLDPIAELVTRGLLNASGREASAPDASR